MNHRPAVGDVFTPSDRRYSVIVMHVTDDCVTYVGDVADFHRVTVLEREFRNMFIPAISPKEPAQST